MKEETGTKQLTALEEKEKAVQTAWLEKGTYTNVHEIPHIEKVVVNVRIPTSIQNKQIVESMVEQVQAITGQAPMITKSRLSIAGFDLREGATVGIKTTLRKRRMYHFLDKVFNYTLPRVRDFRGISSTGFDGQGNYSFTIEDQLVFLEIDPGKVNRSFGVQVTIVTSAKTDKEAYDLLKKIGAPLQDKEESN